MSKISNIKNIFFLIVAIFPFFWKVSFADELGNNSSKVKIKIGGEIDTQFAGIVPNYPYNGSTMPSGEYNPAYSRMSGLVRAMADIEISVKTKNFRYGGLISLQTGKIEDDYGSYGREAYLFLEHVFGKVEIGSVYSSAARMRIDASNIARGTGGIEGDWFRYVPMPRYESSDQSLVMGQNPIFILRPMLPNEAGFTVGAINGNYVYNDSTYTTMYQNIVQPRFGWGSLAAKISYYTKRTYGVQVGISFTPNTGLSGIMGGQPSSYAKDYLGNYYTINSLSMTGNTINLVSLGINYIKQIGNLGIAGSFTYEHGQYQGSSFFKNGNNYNGIPGRADLNAFSTGIKATYGPFAISYSYGNWLNSLMNGMSQYYFANGTSTPDNAFFHSAGLGLTFGPISSSVTYMYSNYRGNVLNVVSVGTDIKLGGLWGRGFVPYFEVSYYDMAPAYGKASDGAILRAHQSSGTVIIGGVKLIF